MAYDVVNITRDVTSYERPIVTLDITSLDAAGAEPIDKGALDLSRIYGASILGHENSDYIVEYDHLNDQLDVVDQTGADVAGGTDVGEVVIEFVGT